MHPQRLSVTEQVAIARSAHVLAGSAGSAVYLGAFQPFGASEMVVSPRHYGFVDDLMISHLRHGELAYFFSADEELRHPAGARYQDHRVDVTRVAEAVEGLRASEPAGSGISRVA